MERRWGEPELKQLQAMLQQDSLFYWQGPQTGLLTERFREVCPLQYVQTCSSGTAALHIAVAAAGIGLGDEVITSPITDIGTVIGVIYQQAVPVFADLGAGTYNLDVADVERRITPRTKAIIAVHLAGNPCDLDALKALADRHKLILIEDVRRPGVLVIAVGRLARWGIWPVSLCRTPSTLPVATGVWWRRTTSGLGRCCRSSATRVAIGRSGAALMRLPRTIG